MNVYVLEHHVCLKKNLLEHHNSFLAQTKLPFHFFNCILSLSLLPLSSTLFVLMILSLLLSSDGWSYISVTLPYP